MNRITQVSNLLIDIEQMLKKYELWSSEPPELVAFESEVPFFVDTMTAEQWLQWVFLPRMRALIDKQVNLPEKIALTPYFEEALPPHTGELITLLKTLDNLLNSHE